ncbi:hypothetical protein BC936DRAFT_149907, partial [Jimgerdemannia flammicorona]
MRECIRWLKKEMAEIVEEDPPLSDDEARHRLVERIEHFIRDRITVADALIVQNGLQKIQNGDVILTYARSSIVQALLLEVHKRGVEFHVIVVDSRPMQTPPQTPRRRRHPMLVRTTLCGAVGHAPGDQGSTRRACAAQQRRGVRARWHGYGRDDGVGQKNPGDGVLRDVQVCNPDDLVETNKATQSAYNRGALSPSDPSAHAPLAGWRDQPNLKLLNLMYDVTPSEYITVVVTEVGLIPCTSAPVIWREY